LTKDFLFTADDFSESRERVYAMKIINNNLHINKLYQQAKKQEVSRKNSVEKKYETVTISADAGKITEAVKLVLQMDDVRVQRVQELQKKINEGSYRVDPEKLAAAMLSRVD